MRSDDEAVEILRVMVECSERMKAEPDPDEKRVLIDIQLVQLNEAKRLLKRLGKL